METLLLIKDTLTTHSINVVDSCRPCVHGAATDFNDFLIVCIVCVTIVIIVLVVSLTVYLTRRAKLCFVIKEKELLNRFEAEKAERVANEKVKTMGDGNANKLEKEVDDFLSFCEDRKDIRENGDFIKFCVDKYKMLMEKRIEKYNNAQ